MPRSDLTPTVDRLIADAEISRYLRDRTANRLIACRRWVTKFRPMLAEPGSPVLWPSERGWRIGLQRINSRFSTYRDALGLDPVLDFHGLRRSYVTHLIEAGRDPLFVQFQCGHEHASTTWIYKCVSSDFRTSTLRRALNDTLAAALGGTTGRKR
ncbi:tyrosine-type recombinase/integrase [Nocardia sp. NPDC049220]|uniref:site-specific integrase n=1 Tax=Nocardia sp. NPDC049220 TaxID=3155273 RepID=UPI0033DEE791